MTSFVYICHPGLDRVSDRKVSFNKMAGIQEGPEFGVGDFVLLQNLSINGFMENLKLR